MTVVAGGSRSGKSHLIAQLRRTRPAGERWAWLSNSAPQGFAGGQEGDTVARAHHEAADANELFSVAGGCACCLAGPAFRTTLVRLLRAGTWQRLHIEVDAAGHAPTLVDQLRCPPFNQYLKVTQLLLTVDAIQPVSMGNADDPLAPSGRLGMATDFLLRSSNDRRTLDAALMLEAAPPWPRLERIAGRRLVRAESGLDPNLEGWRVFSALAPADASESFDLLRQWPADVVALRRPFKDLLSALAADSGIAGFQALMRTERAWYRWTGGRGRGSGALAFDAGPGLVEAETSWRFDNRLCVWLGPGARRQVVEDRLRGLDVALQDRDGIVDPALV